MVQVDDVVTPHLSGNPSESTVQRCHLFQELGRGQGYQYTQTGREQTPETESLSWLGEGPRHQASKWGRSQTCVGSYWPPTESLEWLAHGSSPGELCSPLLRLPSRWLGISD